jgi:hypothetical protein
MWQIIGTISDCLPLKENLKEQIYLDINSTTQRCPIKMIKTSLIEDFFHLPPVLKKFTSLIGYSGACDTALLSTVQLRS